MRILTYFKRVFGAAFSFSVTGLAGLLLMGAAHAKEPVALPSYTALEGLRYGLSVTDLEGNIIASHRADERFMPASVNKLFVTAAALAKEAEITALNPSLRVALEDGGEERQNSRFLCCGQ